jgi:hypothetical protein
VAEMNPKKLNIIQSGSRIRRERKLICKLFFFDTLSGVGVSLASKGFTLHG